MSNYFSISINRLQSIHGFKLSEKYILKSLLKNGIIIQSPTGKKIRFKISKATLHLFNNDNENPEFITDKHLLNNTKVSFFEIENYGKDFNITIPSKTDIKYIQREDMIEMAGRTEEERKLNLENLQKKEIEYLIKYGLI